MKIKTVKNFISGRYEGKPGDVLEVEDGRAAALIAQGIAETVQKFAESVLDAAEILQGGQEEAQNAEADKMHSGETEAPKKAAREKKAVK